MGNELLHHFLVFRCEFEVFRKTFPLLVVSLTVSKLHMLLNCNDNISTILCYVLLRKLVRHFILLVLYRTSPILDFWGLVNAKRDKNLKRLLELVWADLEWVAHKTAYSKHFTQSFRALISSTNTLPLTRQCVLCLYLTVHLPGWGRLSPHLVESPALVTGFLIYIIYD